jgi:hypothetical protein
LRADRRRAVTRRGTARPSRSDRGLSGEKAKRHHVRRGKKAFTTSSYAPRMSARAPTLEADLAALKQAADRAGTALACLFSSADEYEAALIRERRAQGRYRPIESLHRRFARAALTFVSASLLLMLL